MDNKNEILKILNDRKGDDLYRARCAFRNCTPEQMKQEYGESGVTRENLIKEYENKEREIDELIMLVKEKL